MSEEEKMLQILKAIDDSNIDYEHPIWERSIKEGFHDELADFAASCVLRPGSTEGI